jgi:HD-GYP domain-containing protein (c-di-GMP phosphodiesterase class II)
LRARLFEQTRRSLERLSALHTIDLAITSSLDMDISLSVVLDQVMKELQPDAAAIFVYQPGTDRLQLITSRGLGRITNDRGILSLGEGIPGQAVRERKTITIPNLNSRQSSQNDRAGLLLEGAGAVVAAPLISRGQTRGVLQVFFKQPFSPGFEWLDFLQTLSTQTAIALESGLLFQQLQGALEEQKNAYDATIESWAHALELRSQEASGHSERVTRLAVELARRLGLSAAELTDYRRGVLMHDIGKMGIPEKILLKRSRLTPEDWEVIRQHPQVASALLGRIPGLTQAIQIPYSHHERWDGSGYPLGLQGEEIPFAARIFSVIDVWDALINDQPYREAWSQEDTLAYLQANAGVLFDPKVVETFLQMITEGKGDVLLR